MYSEQLIIIIQTIIHEAPNHFNPVNYWTTHIFSIPLMSLHESFSFNRWSSFMLFELEFDWFYILFAFFVWCGNCVRTMSLKHLYWTSFWCILWHHNIFKKIVWEWFLIWRSVTYSILRNTECTCYWGLGSDSGRSWEQVIPAYAS